MQTRVLGFDVYRGSVWALFVERGSLDHLLIHASLGLESPLFPNGMSIA